MVYTQDESTLLSKVSMTSEHRCVCVSVCVCRERESIYMEYIEYIHKMKMSVCVERVYT